MEPDSELLERNCLEKRIFVVSPSCFVFLGSDIRSDDGLTRGAKSSRRNRRRETNPEGIKF